MTARRSAFAFVVATIAPLAPLTSIGCGAAPTATPQPPPTPQPPTEGDDDHSGFAGKPFGVHHSDRLGVSIPLPDLPAWSIDDRADGAGWLVATHADTSTIVRVRRFDETMLVGRRECELRATLVGELPRAEVRSSMRFQTLADEPLRRPKGWDGWRWVALEGADTAETVGHVYLVAGRAHACLVVHVRTRASGAILADRLILFGSGVAAGVTVDRAAEPLDPRPDLPPPPPMNP